jgi:uncharacterized protein
VKFPVGLLVFGYAFLAFLSVAIVLALVERVSPGAFGDTVTLTAAHTLGYALTAFVILRVHAPEASIRQTFALTPLPLLPAAFGLALGATAYPIADHADALVAKRYVSADAMDAVEAFDLSTPRSRIQIALCFLIVLPLVTEVFFRGAIAFVVKERWYLGVLVYMLANAAMRSLASFAILALITTALRYRFRSTWPAMLAHIGFYATPLVPMLVYARQEVRTPLKIAAALAAFAALSVFWLLASMPRSAEPESRVGSEP